ncbi:zinc finger protein 569-like [Protopterus annectens]|uniref:zinc finger protein 569-like n=1 Tax=Protopterus annectens TaxID=7888 RepID=UPI001CFB5857|nr:zinc finger protein 569-like [Protopterus annectens]
MLSKQQKELHRNVMVQNYENMISLGYHIPVEHLLVYIKNDKTIPSAANEGGIAVQEMQLPDTSISINRSTDCTEVWSQQSSLGKCVDSEHVKALLERIVITGHSLMPSESKHHNRMESKDEFGKKIELEMHLEPQEGKEPCRLNHSDNLILHFSGLTDQLNHIGKGRMKMSAIHKQLYTGKKQYKYTIHDKGFTSKVKLAANNITHIRQKLFKCTSHEKRFTQKSRVEKHQYTHTGVKPYVCYMWEGVYTKGSHNKTSVYTHWAETL